jgi:ribonuclease HI
MGTDQRKVYSTIRAIATHPEARKPNEALVVDGKTLTTDLTKANAFARFYAHNSKLQIRKEDRTLHSKISTVIHSLKMCPPQESECAITMQELTTAIRVAPGNSSAGADRVHPSMLKHITAKALQHLLALFNDAWSQGSFPHCWRTAITVTIPKPGKKLDELKSYRPISLLSCVGKLLERIISTRLQAITQQVIPPEQSAYRVSRSSEDSLLSLIQYAADGFQKKKPAERTTLACVDYSAAFDRVWHIGLIKKLSFSVPARYVRFVRSFLTNRVFRVRIGTTTSRANVQKNGTPQGSCLSPMLFVLYTSDLPAHIHASSDSVQVGVYADDVAVWSRSADLAISEGKVQSALDAISDWSYKNYMSINPSKSEGILLTSNTHEHKHLLNLKIRGIPIRTPDSVTYLGITIDRGLFFHKHAANLAATICQRTRAMAMLSGQNWGITTSDLSRLHLSFVLPKIHYCLAAFGAHLSNASILKVDTAILKGCRVTTGMYRGSPNDAIWIESKGTTFTTEVKRACLISYEKSLRSVSSNPRAVAASQAANNRLPNRKNSRSMSLELIDEIDMPTERLSLVELVPPWRQQNISCTPTLPTTMKKSDDNIRAAAEEAIRSHYPTDICIYTDGSAESGTTNGGSSAVFTKGDPSAPIRLKTLRQPAGSTCSSYVCELLAIKIALQECVRTYPTSSILIISDSQSAIAAIQGGSFAVHPHIAEIGLLASRLTQVAAAFCPSHIGVIGNEWADAEANAATKLDQNTAAVDFASAKSYIQRQIKNPPPTHPHTLEVFSQGLVASNFHPDENCRREMRRIRCGHTKYLAAFRHRLNSDVSDLCRFCNAKPETIKHVLTCGKLTREIRDHFGTRRLTLSSTAEDEAGVYGFLADVGIFDPHIC